MCRYYKIEVQRQELHLLIITEILIQLVALSFRVRSHYTEFKNSLYVGMHQLNAEVYYRL